jgi:hypothetical protein
MFSQIRGTRLLAVVAVAAAAALLSSCGGNKTKQTKEQREATAAASRGYETVTTPATELEGIKRELEEKNIPCGIGIGESTDEQTARNVSSDEARTEVAKSLDAQVQRLSESYAQNVDSEAKKIWEEAVRQITNQHIRGSNTVKSIVQYNKDTNRYKIYTLLVMDPKLFKESVEQSLARDEEFELRVKKDDMMRKLDANIAEYDSKYRKN